MLIQSIRQLAKGLASGHTAFLTNDEGSSRKEVREELS